MAAIGIAQVVGPHQPCALWRAVLVGDQLAVDAEQAAQARGAQGQRFDGELHRQMPAMVEEGVANTLGFFQLFQHVAAHQVAAQALGVEHVEVVFEEDVQVLVMELLQPPLRPEKGFKVVQRGVFARGFERVTIGQPITIEAVDLAVPALFQLAQGGYHQHLRGLVREFFDLLVHRFRQAHGNPLQVGNRVAAAERKAIEDGLQRGLAGVRIVVHGLGIVMHGTNGAQGLFIVGRPLPLGDDQLRQAGKGTPNTRRLLLALGHFVQADHRSALDQRHGRVDHGVVAQRFKQTP